ncbi:hypothetical protein ACFQ6O_47140 [Streptomyces sp. NPDC056441]
MCLKGVSKSSLGLLVLLLLVLVALLVACGLATSCTGIRPSPHR